MTPEQAISQLQNLGNNSRLAMKKAEKTIADRIANDAKSDAPGSLPIGISVSQTENQTTIIAGEEIAAYVEFGTGDYAKEYVATLPAEIQEDAEKFFISGKGHGRTHPFFFPAIERHQGELNDELDNELQKLAK